MLMTLGSHYREKSDRDYLGRISELWTTERARKGSPLRPGTCVVFLSGYVFWIFKHLVVYIVEFRWEKLWLEKQKMGVY